MHLIFVRSTYIFLLVVTASPVYSKTKPADSTNLFLGKYPIPKKTPDPININTKQVHHETLPPLFLIGIINALTKLSNSGKSVQSTLVQPFTFAQASGGVLGKDEYQFSEIQHYWTNDTNGTATVSIDGEGFPIVFRVIFRNRKYSTTKEALEQRDGFAIAVFPLKICLIPNILYDPFGAKLKRIQEPGSSVLLFLGTSIQAVDYALPNTIYYAYPGSYFDADTGKNYSSATVIVVPPSLASCITERQFKKSFGLLKSLFGGALISTLPQFPAKMPVVQASGLLQTVVFGV